MQEKKQSAPRFRELDGLRGVAALVVVFHHALLTYPPAWNLILDGPSAQQGGIFWWLTRTPLYLFFSGHAAVVVFFVLSGAVLALTYMEVDRWNYWSYLPKRIARIWLPFVAAILLSAALFLGLHPAPIANLSGWFNLSWTGPLTIRELAKHLAMTGTATWLDNPMWSLVHEIRISLIFPILLLAVLRARWPTLIVTATLSIASGRVGAAIHSPLASNLLDTSQYLFAFAGGAALMVSRNRLKTLVTAASWPILTTAWTVALLLLLFDSPADPFRHLHILGFKHLSTLGALTAVGLSLGGAGSVLASRFPQWLGKVSYSLYLLHVPVILTLLHITAGQNNNLVIVAIGLSLALAGLMQFAVELPSQRLGRLLSKRLSRA